ncbi:MAG TPA: hypothetical protein VGM08_02055 [Candidatus Saccharimonadales bacterium]|jgi:hypothetical protein
MTTSQNTEQQKFWKTARHGWKISIIVGLAVLLIRFKALIPLVWQLLVAGGTVHAIGNVLSDLLLAAVIVGGCGLFIYAVRTGYHRASQELGFNGSTLNPPGGNQSASTIALRVIGQVSLYINAPILYWALFLFVLLPQLVKIPNASLRIGTTAALAGAFIFMAVVVVLATHIGLLLTKFAYRSIMKAPEPAVPFNQGIVVGGQPVLYAQQAAYVQPGSYYPAAPPPGIPAQSLAGGAAPGQPLPYTRHDTYARQLVYPVNPVNPQAPAANNGLPGQAPGESGPSQDNNQPWR